MNNWIEKNLGDLFSFKDGMNAEKAAYGDGVPFVNVMDVFGTDILTSDIVRGGGMYQPSMKTRMDDMEQQKTEILARMADVPTDVPDINPNIAEIYKTKVIQLSDGLIDPELHDQAAEAIRALVKEVVLTPGNKRGEVKATLRGELMGILDIAAGRKTRKRLQVIKKEVASP